MASRGLSRCPARRPRDLLLGAAAAPSRSSRSAFSCCSGLGGRGLRRLLALHVLRLLEHLLDRALHVEGALGDVVVLAVDDLLERAHRLLDRHVLARAAGELLGDEERLREEALDLARARDRLLVLVGELVDPEDGDDVLQLLVALQHLLDLGRGVVVVLAEDVGLEDRRGRVERIHRRVDPLLDQRAGQRRGRVQVGEHRGRGRVGEVVSRHVDRLDRGDRALAGRRDPLLESAHLRLQRRLVADGGGHPARAAPRPPSPPGRSGRCCR